MSKKVVEYIVVTDHSVETLVLKIQDLISHHGWQPLGGIQFATPVLRDEEVAPLYVQSLVQYEK